MAITDSIIEMYQQSNFLEAGHRQNQKKEPQYRHRELIDDVSITSQSLKSDSKPPLGNRGISSYLRSPIATSSLAEIELLLLTFTIGMQDATTFPDYHCFASNQTGNTIMLALAVTMPDKTPALFVPSNIGVSLSLFLMGALITGQLGNYVFGSLSRIWLLSITFMQTAMIFAAAGLQLWYGADLTGSPTLGVIALLAFASGSQVVISRSLRMTEISTAMATAAWVDLMVDPGIIQAKNHPRDRRVFFLLALISGSFIGAGIYVMCNSAIALLVSGLVKVIVVIMLGFNPMDKAVATNGSMNRV